MIRLLFNHMLCIGLTVALLSACYRSGVDVPEPTKRVVILGNSIVAHPPDHSIGWSGDWGMAASARDSDFVHRLEHRIHKINPETTLQYGSVSSFEREYWHYDLDQIANYRDADVLVIKISENISTDSLAERQFSLHYENLVRYLAGNGHTAVIICEGFWPSPVNDTIRHFALSKEYDFVPLQDLYTSDPANTAKGLFTHAGVASHPSDMGMKRIADRIWEKLEVKIHK